MPKIRQEQTIPNENAEGQWKSIPTQRHCRPEFFPLCF